MCVNVYACANLYYEKHLQGHLKRTSNHQFKGIFEGRIFGHVCCPKKLAKIALKP
jgi:hypothetical protein